MAEPRMSEQAIASIVKSLRANRQAHDARLRVRRLLIDMTPESYQAGNGTGTNVPAPYTKSALIIKTMRGVLATAVREYASVFTSNPPRPSVIPLVVDRDTATKRAESTAGKQERLMIAMWDKAGGRKAQDRIGYSQAWGRVGYYFTLPRKDAYGLPDRLYYADLTEQEIDQLRLEGKITPEPIEGPNGRQYAESGESYIERRREHSKAMAADSLMLLATFPPDIVYPAYDFDGVKYAAAVMEVPAMDFGPGTDYAESAARYRNDPQIAKYGMIRDAEGRIVAGATVGGEHNVNSGDTWYYTVFATRQEVYCLVSSNPDGAGTLVWYAEHNGGRCPIIPAPAFHTDSTRPGSEYSSPMEQLFSEAPGINQLETMLSLAAGYNGVPRWVFVKADGSLVRDASGDPVIQSSETTPGLDPSQAAVTEGTPMQLLINADLLVKVLEIYLEQSDKGLPSSALVGGEGYSGSTAWGLRQAIEQANASMQQPVRNHAQAVEEIFQLWGRWIQDYDTDLYAYAAPTGKDGQRSVAGLIQFNPKDWVTSIQVSQSSDTAQAKVIKQAAGIEAMQGGVATLRDYFDTYSDVDDGRAAEMNIYADKMFQMAMFGANTGIEPGSVAYDYMLAMRGEMSQRMLKIPSVALKTATDNALAAQQTAMQQTQQTSMQSQQAAEGNVMAAAGMVQPGNGMSMQPPQSSPVPPPMPVGAA